MTPSLALSLFAISQRPTDRDGDRVRIWGRDLNALVGLAHGTGRTFGAAVRALAAEHPAAVSHDPGYIGGNLSYYLARDYDRWADVFPGMSAVDVYDAADDAGLSLTTPLGSIAKRLPGA